MRGFSEDGSRAPQNGGAGGKGKVTITLGNMSTEEEERFGNSMWIEDIF